MSVPPSAPNQAGDSTNRAPWTHPADWQEDAAHENGCYQNRCGPCGIVFYGHKRRTLCRVCAQPSEGARGALPDLTAGDVADELAKHRISVEHSGEDMTRDEHCSRCGLLDVSGSQHIADVEQRLRARSPETAEEPGDDNNTQRLYARIGELQTELHLAHQALGFAASVIKSGESWSATCEEVIGKALGSPRREGE